MKEGWISEHPASGKPVHVVTADYCAEVEQQAAQWKALARTLVRKVEELEAVIRTTKAQ